MRKKCFNCPNMNRVCVGKNISCNVDKEELREQILNILKIIYINEMELILRDVNEVCLSAHFWFYFRNKYGDLYKDMNIDIEYNRNGMDPKYYQIMTGEELRYAKPDMIIHKRFCNKNNFAFLELKKIKEI